MMDISSSSGCGTITFKGGLKKQLVTVVDMTGYHPSEWTQSTGSDFCDKKIKKINIDDINHILSRNARSHHGQQIKYTYVKCWRTCPC